MPSGFYLVDVLLYLDSLVEGKLYGNGPNRVKLATLDANRVKKLVGSLRYLRTQRSFLGSHDFVRNRTSCWVAGKNYAKQVCSVQKTASVAGKSSHGLYLKMLCFWIE